MAHAEAMASALDTPGADTLVLEREYFSQSIDTAAFELDNGNGWFDAANATMHLVTATQSPQEVAEDGARMLAARGLGVKRLCCTRATPSAMARRITTRSVLRAYGGPVRRRQTSAVGQ